LLFSYAQAVFTQTDAVDDYIAEQMEAGNLPGLALMVLRDGEVVKAAGYGVADRDRGIPVTPETVFKLASVSKQFIASGIMLLVQEGQLDVSDPVGRFLEDAPDAWDGITLRHLLTHTSGLMRTPPAYDGFAIQSDIDLIRSAYDRPLLFEPGAQALYSNLGYWILAETITRVSGMPWPEFIAARIFDRLDMRTAGLMTMNGGVPNRARGYTDNSELRDALDFPAVRPSGAFQATILDLAEWDAALYTDDILTAATKEEMWTAVTLNDGSTAPWGYGWQVAGRHVYHSGDLPGFAAELHRYPEDGLTVIVLINSDDTNSQDIAAEVARFYRRGEGPGD
jgi:CubicO group peptidase (beta-lactamase class C family)